MSKTNLIALAIAAALASPAAYAVDVTPATPDVFPTNAMSGTANIQNSGAITIAASADDNYLGRSTGYNVRVGLSNGAVFNTAVDPTQVTFISPTAHTGTVTVAGGGQPGDNSVTFSVVPDDGTVEGDGISIAANAFDIKNIGFLASGSAALKIDVRVGDPVGGGELGVKNGTAIASAKEGWAATYSAPGNTDIRIDVGSDSAKKVYSYDGDVNDADGGVFNAGSVDVALATGLTNQLTLDEAVATAPLTITGVDFTPFTNGGSVFLDDTGDCDSTTGTVIPATVAADKASASVPATTTVDDLQVSKYVCFVANGNDTIAAQAISATVTVAQTGTVSSPAFADSGDKLLDMTYNGAVKDVWHFNPSTNANQVSYLRITNSSSTPGLFTIDGVCDDGTSGSSVTFNLANKHSILLTSNDIENGNATKGLTGAMGSCVVNGPAGQTGKRHLVITGEVGAMEVQNFLRNKTSAGDINTNVNNAN